MPKNKSITIGEVTVSPGERANVNLPIADLYTATSLFMPLQILCGRNAGPTMFVSAALHGDEINGVEVQTAVESEMTLKQAIAHLPLPSSNDNEDERPSIFPRNTHEPFAPRKQGMDPDEGNPEAPLLRVKITTF